MPRLQYVGTSHFREVSKSDWKSAGIDHDKTHWDRDDETVLDVSDEVVAFLTKTEKGQFKVVEDEPESLTSLSESTDTTGEIGQVGNPTAGGTPTTSGRTTRA